MASLEELKKDNVEFRTSEIVEFLDVMLLTADKERLTDFAEKADFKPDDQLINMIDDLKEKNSNYLQNELNYFFNIDFPIGYIFGAKVLAQNPALSSVEEFITAVKEAETTELFLAVTDQLFDLEESVNSTAELLELVKKSDLQKNKERLINCLQHPEEIKGRWELMLEQFYKIGYQNIVAVLPEDITKYKTKYQNKFQKQPDHFINQYLKFNHYLKIETKSCKEQKVYIYVSYCKQFGVGFGRDDDTLIIIMGAYNDQLAGTNILKKRIKKLFKALSDEKRLTILELLKERSWYGHELAEELDLTPATISYHTTLLAEIDIIDLELRENRSYLSLNESKIEDLFNEAKTLLFPE